MGRCNTYLGTRRRSRIACVFGPVLLATCFAGCLESKPSQADRYARFNKGPGDLNKEEIQQRIVEENKWQSASLADGQDGVYAGTAVDAQGQQLDIEVRQSDTELDVLWKTPDGRSKGRSGISWSAK